MTVRVCRHDHRGTQQQNQHHRKNDLGVPTMPANQMPCHDVRRLSELLFQTGFTRPRRSGRDSQSCQRLPAYPATPRTLPAAVHGSRKRSERRLPPGYPIAAWNSIPERVFRVEGLLAIFWAHGPHPSPEGLFADGFGLVEESVLELGCRGHLLRGCSRRSFLVRRHPYPSLRESACLMRQAVRPTWTRHRLFCCDRPADARPSQSVRRSVTGPSPREFSDRPCARVSVRPIHTCQAWHAGVFARQRFMETGYGSSTELALPGQ